MNNLEKLPPAMRKTYLKVSAYLKDHPESTVQQAVRASKVNSSQYYLARVRLGLISPKQRSKKQRKKVVHEMQALLPQHVDVPIVALVGKPDEISKVLKGLL